MPNTHGDSWGREGLIGGMGGGGVEGRRIFLDLKTNVVDDGANSESRYRLLTRSVKVG